MKKKESVLFWLAVLALLVQPVGAMTLSDIMKITTNPERFLYGYEDSFALSGQKAVWIDFRDSEGNPQLFGVRLEDPNLTEFLIDPDAKGIYALAFSDPFVMYTYTEGYGSPTLLKIADIQNPNEPLLTVFTPVFNDIYGFDITDHLVVYYGQDAQNDYLYTVLALDFSDPNQPLHYLIDIAAPDSVISSLDLDGPFAVWNEIPSEGPALVKIADLTHPAQPQIVSVQLPEEVVFDTLAVSDNNLAASGYRNWQMYLYAVKNYRNTEQWTIQAFWDEASRNEYLVSGPEIDESIILWVVTTRAPAAAADGLLQREPGFELKAGCLMDSGVSISTLLSTTDPNQISAAVIDSRQVVWSMGAWEQIDLYKGSLALECGDWGYKPGDINKDCVVNLEDLACLAQNWLTCTTPEQEGCEYGS